MSGRTVVRRNSGSVWKQCPPGHQVMLLRRLLAPRAHAVGGDDGVVGALQREQRAGRAKRSHERRAGALDGSLVDGEEGECCRTRLIGVR
ncbi:MAG: hypothetical protein ACXVHB_28155 [Solirubrobacteraceae bacterium]